MRCWDAVLEERPEVRNRRGNRDAPIPLGHRHNYLIHVRHVRAAWPVSFTKGWRKLAEPTGDGAVVDLGPGGLPGGACPCGRRRVGALPLAVRLGSRGRGAGGQASAISGAGTPPTRVE